MIVRETTASGLTLCRKHRESEGVRAMLTLLERRMDESRERLLRASPEDVPRLQGAALALAEIVREVRSDPPEQSRRDGAYS